MEKTVDLAAVVRSAVNLIADRSDRLSIDMRLRTPLVVRADRERLLFALGALLDSATAQEGHGHIGVELRRGAAGPEIVIRDSRPHAGGDATSRSRLSIARRVVELHNGTLDIYRDGDAGTTVTLRLPLSRMADDTRAVSV